MNCGARTPVRAAVAVVTGVFALALLAQRAAQAGHEATFYPSFYPQEIRIETLAPAAAAAGWNKARVHAYVGGNPFAGGPVPADAAAVQSLRSYVVLTFDSGSARFGAGNNNLQSRCAAARQIVPALAAAGAGYVFHPYPVTPYHADYLEQSDLARRAQTQYAARGRNAASGPVFRIRAKGPLAQTLVSPAWRATAGAWDATVEEIDVAALAAGAGMGPGGWDGPPWVKQGWFQAYRLYRGSAASTIAQSVYRRLVEGDYRDTTERINLERTLVSTLTAGCRRVVVGYTLQTEYFNANYSYGVENVAFDSQAGLLSPLFPRTVKLKDFPWNGWLRLGMATKPTAAWNPVGGFTDGFGRLMWLAVADPALLPAPHGGSWIPNRVHVSAAAASGAVPIPGDAVMPEAGTGILRPVGAGKTAQQQLRYSIVMSAFHDGTTPSVADILYPYMFAFRWGVEAAANRVFFDPVVARSTALMRQWLAGFKVIGVTTQVKNFGSDMKFTYQVPIVEVYLNHRSGDQWEAAAFAPPWSTLPWEVIVLMEQAVRRGIAAFSDGEARRRGVPWLDLVRNRATGERLAGLVERFRQEGYRPEALKELVSADEARSRWTALARFYAQHRHFLVTNGPYRVGSWSRDGVVLEVFRDRSYPLGVGTFDEYAIPLRAYASKIEDHGNRVEIHADVERVFKFARSYEIRRKALGPAIQDDVELDHRPECRYIIIGSDGKVVRAGAESAGDSGRFILDLKALPAPGRYTILTALYVGGNSVNPEIKVIEHRAGGGS